MAQALRDTSGLKILLSISVLAYLVYVYFDILSDLGDLYPGMIWDEVVSGLLGLGLVLLWYRVTTKWLKR